MSRKRAVQSVLIANRGEIAVRLIRTLRSLGMRTVVTCSKADRDSLAVAMADDFAMLGPAPASESYLRVDKILDAARSHGVDAVHPGYGFLAERQEFARAVEDAGLVFLGPTPSQIGLLGDKLEARRIMQEAGIGPVQGTHEPLGDLKASRSAIKKIGYPLLLKAAAGGGGRGIRIVRRDTDLESAFRTATSEAENSFGSPLLFAERYLEGARHVEVQVLGDGEGGARLFLERECSIQRRLQKLIEESPSPAVSQRTREQLLRGGAGRSSENSLQGAGHSRVSSRP